MCLHGFMFIDAGDPSSIHVSPGKVRSSGMGNIQLIQSSRSSESKAAAMRGLRGTQLSYPSTKMTYGHESFVAKKAFALGGSNCHHKHGIRIGDGWVRLGKVRLSKGNVR